MKNPIFILLNILILVVLTLPAPAQDRTKRAIEGNWLGILEVSGLKLRLVLKVAKTGRGYAAKFDSPDQGARDLPIDTVTLAGDKMSLSAADFGMSYEGTLNEKGDEISGTFRQGAGSTPFVFKQIVEVPKNKRPQDPNQPYPYAVEEVTYKNEKDHIKLAGTLTFPHGAGKFPVVILITGSGTQDRDETIAGHRPFLVLADYLTRQGIAVLRVDDRGIGGSGGNPLSATTENLAGDVLAGIEFLKTRKKIDPKYIGLIGHSEGGMIAPLVAVQSNDVAFIVMLAGPGQTGEELIYTQLPLLQKASGIRSETIAQSVGFQESLLSIILAEPDNKLAEQKINELLAQRKAGMNERQIKEFEQIETDVKSHLSFLLSPWYRYFLSYNPRPTLEKVKIPVLALNGENDLQVSSKENLALISAALQAGGNKDFTVKSFPKLNHLFQTSRTGLLSEYGEIEETISPPVLETISTWIMKRTPKR